ncbi:MAG: hypothetical protein K0R92_2386 [Lachnospiraceae bacterium]|jgi:hypothetical protein|nr:hypothetical protein [Lachnospiraceae bacterium]
MLVQIEYYDNDVLTNLISILSTKPDKVIFIYDKDVFNKNSVENIYRASKVHLNNLQYEIHTVDSDNLEAICTVTQQVVPIHDECIIDLTGGGDLMTIAGYQIGQRLGLQMIYADIRKNKILEVETGKILCNAVKLSIEDYLTAKGAALLGNSHLVPKKEEYKNILLMANYIFHNLSKWQRTCKYNQITLSGRTSLRFYNKKQIRYNGQIVSPSPDFLRYAEKLGFITELKMGKVIEYTFTSELAKQYLTTYGIWLELYVYLQAQKIKGISDVRLGAMIDWNALDGIRNVGNEIDVVISKDSRPIFISCKLTNANAAAVNEIIVNMRRVGGPRGKGILVTFSDIKKDNSGVYQRAASTGIRVLDKSDLLSGEFGDRLKRTVDEVLAKDIGM